MKRLKYFKGGFILSVIVLIMACNAEYPNLLRSDYGDDLTGRSDIARKVLYVIIDGVNGDVVKEIAPPNITQYADHAMYTYEGLTDIDDYVSNEATGWATLMTGYSPRHHGVVGMNTDIDFADHPTIFKMMDGLSNALYSSSSSFGSLFGDEADAAYISDSDELVKDDVVAGLPTTDKDLTVVHFTSVDEAGTSAGYTGTNTSYVEAIRTMDGYISDIIEAINSRATLSKEDWLVVVTSNRGSAYGDEASGNNYFLNPEKNNFLMVYNPKLASRYYARPGTEIPFDRGTFKFLMNPSNPTVNATKAIMADASQFNMEFPEVGSGYTFEFKFKYFGNATSSSWPEILTKGTNRDNASGGFALFSSSGSGGFQYRVGSLGAAAVNAPIGDGDWHTMTIVIGKETASSVMCRIYFDGDEVNNRNVGNITSISNNFPWTIGRISGGGVGSSPVMNVSQFTIFATPFTATMVQNNFCKTEVDETHVAYGSLAGLWRFDEMRGLRVENQVTNNPNQAFLLSGDQAWEHINNYEPKLCPPVTNSYYKVVPFAVDVPLMIAVWLRANYNDYKSLDGRVWSFTYGSLSAE